ncbi:S24/S26 family peptidase, partial [candidate division WOR-3 bacterium]|nr:S24/S26 family peptidase [candidate division WOR-3 bacterium]
QDAPVLGPNRAGDHLAENEPLAANRPLRVVYTGTSMNPTLVEPELLEVVPGPVRPGDVACFRPPGQDRLVIHRVAAAGPGGIRTRGDSCSGNDDWVLGQDDIIGRIAAARRGNRLRAIAGGRAGLAVARRIRLGRFLRRCAGLVPHRLYCLLSRLGPFDRLLPGRFRPRLVSFDVRGLKRLKLLAGRREIGRYSFRDRRWTIRRPFRLLVDERALAGADTLFRAGEKRD